jgi:hypothetical protein
LNEGLQNPRGKLGRNQPALSQFINGALAII